MSIKYVVIQALKLNIQTFAPIAPSYIKSLIQSKQMAMKYG